MLHGLQILVLCLFSHLLSLDSTVTNDEGQVLGLDVRTLTLTISIHGTLQWALIYG